MSALNFLVIFTLTFCLEEAAPETVPNRHHPSGEADTKTPLALDFAPHKLLQSPAPFHHHASRTTQDDPPPPLQAVDDNDASDLATFVDEIFEPHVPFAMYEDTLPLVANATSSGGNCTGNHSTGDCTDEGSSGVVLLHAPTLQRSTVVKVVVLSVISLFSYAGNVATQASILRTGRQASSTVYMLLLQLTVADLLVTTFCLLTDAVWMATVQWYGGDALCRAVKFMQTFSLYLSTYVLVLIGFDRLCAVRWPMGRARARRDVRRGIVVVWLLSALFSAPQALIFSVMRGPFVEEFFQCVTYGSYTAPWQEQLYTTASLVLMFLLPLVILVATYITTFITIASQEHMFSDRPRGGSALAGARSKILQKAKAKSLMITVLIVAAFLLCWTPYYVTMLVAVFLDARLGETLQHVVFFFGSSAAALNPLIYGAFHLRRRRGRPSKSTSACNTTSSSSRLETSLVATFRGRTRRSREEPLANGRVELLSNGGGQVGPHHKSTGQSTSLL